MRKLTIIPWISENEIISPSISPAVNSLPKWFSKMPRYLYGDSKWRFFARGLTNQTIKACPPFLDSMMSGYMVTLPCDVIVEKSDSQHVFRWGFDREIVSGHDTGQTSSEQVPSGYSQQPHKWNSFYGVKLPLGYSALFVHPLNRNELPFHTMSGVVDVDLYNSPVNLPFFIREDFEGIIEAGTPIAQIIPIKREVWRLSANKYSKDVVLKNTTFFKSHIKNVYKKVFWSRKEYR
jgi:hypothetical protein